MISRIIDWISYMKSDYRNYNRLIKVKIICEEFYSNDVEFKEYYKSTKTLIDKIYSILTSTRKNYGVK